MLPIPRRPFMQILSFSFSDAVASTSRMLLGSQRRRNNSFIGGRQATRHQQSNKPFKGQLQEALQQKLAALKPVRTDLIPPRPHHDVIKAGMFFIATGGVTYTVGAIYAFGNAQKQFRSLIDQTIYEFQRIFATPSSAHLAQPAEKIVWSIIGANTVIFLLWKIKSLSPVMWQFFTNSIASRSLCLPMLLSVFSHSYFFHLFLNMYVLHNFASGAVGFLGPEQFLATFLTGGVFSSLCSLCHKTVVRSAIPSLGASGAICAVMGYICTMLPDLRLHLIILPIAEFSAQNGLYGMLIFELMCLLRIIRFRSIQFDNAAHLGGLIFGIFYAKYGEEYYLRNFKPAVIDAWKAKFGGTPMIASYDGGGGGTRMDQIAGYYDAMLEEEEEEPTRKDSEQTEAEDDEEEEEEDENDEQQ